MTSNKNKKNKYIIALGMRAHGMSESAIRITDQQNRGLYFDPYNSLKKQVKQ